MKVIKSVENKLVFDNGLEIIGVGDEDCCAKNYLDFEQLPVGTEVPTMTGKQLAKNITLKKDGFIIKDINGVPKWVQARSNQNGYYSAMTTLNVAYRGETIELARLEGEEYGY